MHWRSRGEITRSFDTKRGSGLRPHRRPLNIGQAIRSLLPRVERRAVRPARVRNGRWT